MKKATVLVLLVVILLGCITGCKEEVSRKPVDARFTPAHSQVETNYTYVYDYINGSHKLMPNTRTVYYDNEYALKWIIHYDDGSSNVEWIECSEAEYESFWGRKKHE